MPRTKQSARKSPGKRGKAKRHKAEKNALKLHPGLHRMHPRVLALRAIRRMQKNSYDSNLFMPITPLPLAWPLRRTLELRHTLIAVLRASLLLALSRRSVVVAPSDVELAYKHSGYESQFGELGDTSPVANPHASQGSMQPRTGAFWWQSKITLMSGLWAALVSLIP